MRFARDGTHHVDVLHVVYHTVVIWLELTDEIVRLLFGQLLASVGGQCFHDRFDLNVPGRRIAFEHLQRVSIQTVKRTNSRRNGIVCSLFAGHLHSFIYQAKLPRSWA